MSSYQDLLAKKTALDKQTADLDKQIQEAHRAERSGVIASIKQLLTQHDLTVEDLGLKGGAPKGAKSGNAGKTVAPKYRDATTDTTWTGRGLQPKWVQAAIASGKTLDDLKI